MHGSSFLLVTFPCAQAHVHFQLYGADILFDSELTLTLLEAPNLSVVVLGLGHKGSTRCSQGTTLEMSCILLFLINMDACY